MTLQDALAVDVNVVLFAAFTALRRAAAVSAADVAHWDDAVRSWRAAVVEPLRGVRRHLTAATPLRADVAAIELRAEQYEQAMLFALCADDVVVRPSDPPTAVASALAVVLGMRHPDALARSDMAACVRVVADAITAEID